MDLGEEKGATGARSVSFTLFYFKNPKRRKSKMFAVVHARSLECKLQLPLEGLG